MEGYAKLARYMGDIPEQAIFRRFASLNAQNILYLQAELTDLEKKLHKYAEEDEKSTHQERRDYTIDWFSLQMSTKLPTGPNNDGRQWQTFLNIRARLQEYNAAILQQKELARLEQPNVTDLKHLTEWMARPSMGNLNLAGEDSDIWEKTKHSELLAIKIRQHDDLFSKWIADKGIWWLHYALKRDVPGDEESPHLAGTVIYSDTKLARIARVLGTMLACVLPVLAISILYVLDSEAKRLGAIAGLTALFSFCLVILTGARIVDIFATTAAFAAVCVVYIGSPSLQRS